MELSNYRERAGIKDTSDLRADLVSTHSYLPQQFVSNTIDSFLGRLDLLIEKEGRQFEHVRKERGGGGE